MGSRRGGPYPLPAAVGAIWLALCAAPAAHAQSAGAASEDLTAELALRIAATIAPLTQVGLEVPDAPVLYREIAARLDDRGVRAVAGDVPGLPHVRATCLDNPRERSCSAEIVSSTSANRDGAAPPARHLVMVTRAHPGGAGDQHPGLAIGMQPIVSAPAPILDVAMAGNDLLVLSPASLVRYERRAGEWQPAGSRRIGSTRPWPRDVRGRIRVTEQRVEAFLPGLTCAGGVGDAAWSCREDSQPWPLAMEDAALAPGRNHFTVPVGPSFYGVARLGADAGARWAVVTLDRRLAFVDERGSASTTGVVADDVVAVRAPCSAAPYLLVVAPDATATNDVATAYRVTGRQLEAVAAPLVLAGRATAIWPSADPESVTVVTRDSAAGRHDALQITVSCRR